MKRFLISGGCGSLGAPLAKALLAQGHTVSTLDNYSRGSRSRLKDQDVCFYYGDVCDYNVVKTAVKGHDAVIHLAAINGTKNFYDYPSRVLEVGTKGIINIMDACVEHGVEELLIASSSEVYQTPLIFPTPENVPFSIPDPLNPRYSYAASKIISEMFALHYKSECFSKVIVIRPHNCYGPDCGWDHVIPQLVMKMNKGYSWFRTESIEVQGTGEESRCFCFIDDMISGMMTILNNGKHREIYNIGTEEEITINKLSNLIAEELSRMGNIPMGLMKKSVPLQEGSPSRRQPDISKIKELGWEPKVMLEEGLRKTIPWYLKHPLEGKTT